MENHPAPPDSIVLPPTLPDDDSLRIEQGAASLSLADVPLDSSNNNNSSSYRSQSHHSSSRHDDNDDNDDDDIDEAIPPNIPPETPLARATDVGASLASPEDTYNRVDHDPDRPARVKFCFHLWLIVVGLFAMVIVVTLITHRIDDNDNNSNNISPDTTTTTTTRPSLEDIVSYLTLHEVSKLDDLMKPNSPQNLAAHWMAQQSDDNLVLQLPTELYDRDYFYVARYVLAVHYFALNGVYWNKKTHFLSEQPICAWNGESWAFDNSNTNDSGGGGSGGGSGGIETGGLTCDPVTALPIGLDLEFNNLSGEIPTEIGLLTTLQFLDFEYNANLRGTLPTEICQLHQLQTLGIRENQFTGSLPSCLGEHLTQLHTLFVAHNQFTGSLPTQLCQMTSLQYLAAHENRLTGSLPDCVGQWTALESLQLHKNRLTGSLPSTAITQWQRLQELWLYSNRFTGTLPAGIATAWTRIQHVYLEYNRFRGALPHDWSAWEHLESLIVSGNQFNGTLPAVGLEQATNLRYLVLSNNQFTGQVPTEWQRITSLREVFLDDNLLQGNPLPILTSLTKLRLLYLENNLFHGSLDAENDDMSSSSSSSSFAQNWTNLLALDMSSNNFTSTNAIPPKLFQLPRLQVLDLSNNGLQGSLPTDIPRNEHLHFLSLHDNFVNGNIPSSLGNLEQLLHLDLSSNRFQGTLPDELFTYNRLQHLFLANNPGLTAGPIPSGLETNLRQLTELSLKNTNRQGPLPQLVSFTTLLLLDLDKNDFTGIIPTHYGQLGRLRYLMLNRNPRLTGTLPAFTDTPDLQTILLDGTNVTGDYSTLCQLPVFLGMSSSRTSITNDQVVVADCGELNSPVVNCTCCYCCYDAEVTDTSSCSDPLVASMDWSWERGYKRQARDFGLNLSTLAAAPPSRHSG